VWRVVALTAFFFSFDFAFLGANALKIGNGGWVPLVIGISITTLMLTWKRGRLLLHEIMQRASMPLDLLLSEIEQRPPVRVPGTAVFLTSDEEGAPVVLLHHLKHNKALHEQVVLMSVASSATPDIPPDELLTVTRLSHGFYRVKATYGFMETPNVPEILELARKHGLKTLRLETSFYLGRERVLPTGASRMARWRKKIFIVMSRNAQSATHYFGLPPNRVVELGAQVEL
jgi:KUP system potassium uptake protein